MSGEAELASEARESRRRRLRELVARPEWTEVFEPAVRAWIESLAWRVVADMTADLPDIRYRQGQHAALTELLHDPVKLLRWLDKT